MKNVTSWSIFQNPVTYNGFMPTINNFAHTSSVDAPGIGSCDNVRSFL